MSEFYVEPESLRRYAHQVSDHARAAEAAAAYADSWLVEACAVGVLFDQFDDARCDVADLASATFRSLSEALQASGDELAASADYYATTDEDQAAEHDGALPDGGETDGEHSGAGVTAGAGSRD
ncbi:hypothetical protein Bcav_2810 [Beutenbergia cavernae DSM 12333]|uniref:Uncharacterized protein n=1 Tax=Beutenbergia cavernae (strain ATCC BAA-8 / DSM 12333 / CCUG 43141 / JCM 11478 / NBRC 16432 / NCIMB 13614 / HKI 0122) TaxID=471853 RepID=C5BYF5_BEUC1|nr:type VII secretion target [Beutenbergia cavernae]ACQ81055.1 hypothetical protein Bcav_2810 [Beutenbergia cavernae DSM 12333]